MGCLKLSEEYLEFIPTPRDVGNDLDLSACHAQADRRSGLKFVYPEDDAQSPEEAVDASGKTLYAYDSLGRISSETKKDLADAVLSVVSNVYDKASNRTLVSYPGGKTLVFTYTKRNLLSTVIDDSEVTTYTYDANGNRTGLTLPNGVVTTTAFDAANRVVSLENKKDSVVIYTTGYFMDKVGTRLKITETRDASTRNLIYTYDSVYRLLSESQTLNGEPGTVNEYTYDDAGNRTSRTVFKPSTNETTVTTYTLDQLNRVTSAITGADTVSYAYDLNGNQTSKTANGSTQNRVYDRENRLISVNDGGASTLFTATYDYRTRRMSKTENNTTTLFNYDGGENIQELDASRTITKQLIRGTGMGGGIGSVLYTTTSTSTEYFCYNAIGSVVALTNTQGNVASTTDYEAFGNVVASTGSTQENRLFCTKERSASIGLDNFGFRYYDAELGRFITRDPSGYPDGANNYIYCSNNPVNFIDPLGLSDNDEKKWYEKAWEKTKDAAAIGGAFVKGAGEGLVTEAKAAGSMLMQSGANISDAANMAYQTGSLLATGEENSLFDGYAGSAAESVSSGSISAGEYYKENLGNLATVGMYDQGKAVIERSYGLIGDQEFTERVGGAGVVQLGGATIAKYGNVKGNASKTQVEVEKGQSSIGLKQGQAAINEALSELPKKFSTPKPQYAPDQVPASDYGQSILTKTGDYFNWIGERAVSEGKTRIKQAIVHEKLHIRHSERGIPMELQNEKIIKKAAIKYVEKLEKEGN